MLGDFFILLPYLLILLIGGGALGYYMAYLFDRPVTPGIEKNFLELVGCNPQKEMSWKEYAVNLLLFNLLGAILLFLILTNQSILPLNPQQLSDLTFWPAFNITISFVTNTNWQSYAGEVTLSYFSQMVGLTVQNFLSASTGICVLLVLIRSLRGRQNPLLGNFWVDMTRSTLGLLLPLSFLLALFYTHQGVIQNFLPYQTVTTLEGIKQIIPMGPVASQEAIKQLGTNGGGFFAANSAHPLENPTPLTNFFSTLAILLIPLASLFMFGRMIRAKNEGRMLLSTVLLIFIPLAIASIYFELQGNPYIFNLPFLEGKEWRFTQAESALWSVATTMASNGSVNAMHSSLSPLSGAIALFNMMLGEIIFGGVGSGLYGLLLFVFMTVFLCGLMVGRTPEYLGKKIEAYDMIWVSIAILTPGLFNLLFSAISLTLPVAHTSLSHTGAHGLSEVLYAFSSALGNNGSAFGGLKVDTDYYNMLTGIGMLIGRYVVIVPVLALSGSLALKKRTPVSSGTLRTDSPLFMILLIFVILVIGALTFFPVLVLGPIAEYLLLIG